MLLAEFFRLCPTPSSAKRDLLRRWFWVTSFTGWFGGVTSTLAHRALEEMRELARDKKNDFDVVELGLPARPFPTRFDGRSARVRAFMLYLASLRPRSVRGAGELRIGPLVSELGTEALAHVVKKMDRSDLVSSPANRMFADRELRGQVVGDLERIVREGDEDVDALLASHGFPPEARQMLESGAREPAIESRLASLIDGEREFMRVRQVTWPVERTGVTVWDSDASEDE